MCSECAQCCAAHRCDAIRYMCHTMPILCNAELVLLGCVRGGWSISSPDASSGAAVSGDPTRYNSRTAAGVDCTSLISQATKTTAAQAMQASGLPKARSSTSASRHHMRLLLFAFCCVVHLGTWSEGCGMHAHACCAELCAYRVVLRALGPCSCWGK